MRLATYRSLTGPRTVGMRDGEWIDLNQADAAVPHDIREILAQGPEGLQRAARAAAVGEPIARAGIEWLPVVPHPEKIIGVGKNYAEHARETGAAPPGEPMFFAKFPSAILAHEQPIVLPAASREVDYEAELVAVIGIGGRDIPKENAIEHIAGYCCGNDVSARDWQKRKPGGQWTLGKSFDTFAPIGPTLVTADEIPRNDHLDIRLRLNGRVMQESNTAEMLFSVAELIAYLSQVCTLTPGDLIFTGTPSGVGFARQPPVFLQPGDVVEVEIERIGTLRNPVVADRCRKVC